MICWYCHWGLPRPIATIYSALMALVENPSAVEYGPAHIVWSDENFDDDSIRHCIENCRERKYCDGYSIDDVAKVLQSLQELLDIPESVRCCVPGDYDGENPHLFPPAPGFEMGMPT